MVTKHSTSIPPAIAGAPTAIVVARSIVEVYKRRVVPIIEACELRDVTLDNDELVQQDLSLGNLEYWPLSLSRPRKGRVYTVTPRKPHTHLFDTRVLWSADPPDGEEDVRVRVDDVVGECVVCSLTDEPADPLEHDDWPAIMLVGQHASYLVGMFPESDTLWAWTCWPHERLPLRYALQRPRKRPVLADAGCSLMVLADRSLMLAVKCDYCAGEKQFPCDKCEATGRIQCRRCEGEGSVLCRKCNGEGRSTCRRCGGNSTWTCRKCGGSGSHPAGECFGCQGTGIMHCKVCEGEGAFGCGLCQGHGRIYCQPCDGNGFLGCYPCGGTGQRDCAACAGLGIREPRWQTTSPVLKLRRFCPTKEARSRGPRQDLTLPLSAAHVYDRHNNCFLSLPAGGHAWINGVVLACHRYPDDSSPPVDESAITDHQKRIAQFDRLLEQVLASRDERATGPIPFRRSSDALRVSHDQVVYRLTLERGPHFASTSGELPLPLRCDLIFGATARMHRDDQLPLRWHVAFPRGVDEQSIPLRGFLNGDRPRPAERTLQDEVRRWTKFANRLNPSLRAIVSPAPPRNIPAAPNLQNPRIAGNEAQLEAVRMGLSDTPLALIKGPPGTGKTTVIVELILQAAAQGQKVLICSQTHQAVRNVLERLDDRGDVRMYRYGRDEKLSDLERKYARGGSATADTHGTLRLARERASTEREAYEKEAADVIAYERAQAALARLETLSVDRTKQLSASASQEAEDSEIAERYHQEAEAAADARTQNLLEQLKATDANLLAEQAAADEGLALLETRLRHLGLESMRDAHPEPTDIDAPPRIRQQRLRLCLAALRQHEPRFSALSVAYEDLAATLSSADNAFTSRRTAALAAFDSVQSDCEAQCRLAIQEADQQKQAADRSATASKEADVKRLEPPLVRQIMATERTLRTLGARQSKLEQAIAELDAGLAKKAGQIRAMTNREPRRTAVRGNIVRRFLSPFSAEVIEGEWATGMSKQDEQKGKLASNTVDRLKAEESLANLQKEFEAARSRTASEYESATNAAAAQLSSCIAKANAARMDRMSEASKHLEATIASARLVYDQSVGEAPSEAERVARLLETERSLTKWWARWKESLLVLGAGLEAASTNLDGQLSNRKADLYDDACHPVETEARLAEISSAATVLRGIIQSAAMQLSENNQRRQSATSEHATASEGSAAQLASRLLEIRKERFRRDAIIEDRIRQDREHCQAQLDLAADIATGLGISATSSDTNGQWQQRIDAREPVVRPLRERMEFTGRWVADLKKSDGVVEKLHWRHIDAFLATCVGVSGWRELNADGPEAVDLVIVDEAAHATLPEVLPPLRFGRRVLLIGDEMQLPPITAVCTRQFQPDGDWLAEEKMDPPPPSALVAMSDDWMERSLFEWIYLRRQGIPRVMLDRQFRMHPHIGEFISQVFYDGKLINGVSAADRHLTFGDFQSAVCVVSTSQYPERYESAGSGPNGTSYSNATEAKIVTRILQQAASGLSQSASFGIITPYAAQKKLLQDSVTAIMSELTNINLDPEEDIGSVDSYQGSERDCIIVSMVRSPAECPRCCGRGTIDSGRCNECRGRGFRGAGLTFARDLRRLNVAFSRARCSLIVVGDFARLCDPSIRGGEEGGKILQQFAEHVLSKGGTVQHVWEGGSNES